jgi:hypothetical protein
MVVLLKTAQVSEHEAEAYSQRAVWNGKDYGLKEMPAPVFQKACGIAMRSLGPGKIVYEAKKGDKRTKLMINKVSGW